MRTTWISAVSVLALLAAPVLAQTTDNAAPHSTGSRSDLAPPEAPKQLQPDPFKQEDVLQIKGASVYGSDNKKIGAITTVLMRPDSRQIDRVVVGAGGLLGVGAHNVALPVDQFRWDAEAGAFRIAQNEADLKAMPAWLASGADKEMSGSTTAAPRNAPATNR
jgi:hypothetical protein